MHTTLCREGFASYATFLTLVHHLQADVLLVVAGSVHLVADLHVRIRPHRLYLSVAVVGALEVLLVQLDLGDVEVVPTGDVVHRGTLPALQSVS